MIKGAQRRMVEIRTPDSKLFETAYFLLRPQPMPEADAHDMIAEADRIIAHSTDCQRERRSFAGLLRGFLPAFFGMLIGGVLVGLVWLITSL